MAEEKNYNSKMVFVSSKDRVNLNSMTRSNFSVSLGRNADLNNVVKVILRSAHLRNSCYNVVFGRNDAFRFSYNTVPQTLNIAPGFYSIGQLTAFLKAQIDISTGAVSTFTLNQTTNILTLSVNIGAITVFTLAGGSTISPNLGFTANQAEALSIVAQTGVDLSGITSIFIKSRALSTSNALTSDGDLTNIFSNVPLTVPYGAIQHYEPSDTIFATVEFQQPRDIGNLDIFIVDINGDEVDFNGYDVEFVFRVFY